MRTSKNFTVVAILVQLIFISKAAKADLIESAPKFPNVQQCYRLDAEALEKTIPRLEALKKSEEFKEILGLVGILNVLKDDFLRRSKEADYGYQYWVAVFHSDVGAADFDKQIKGKCVEAMAQMERDYLNGTLVKNGLLPYVSERQQKQFVDRVIEEYVEQARQLESGSAR